MSSSLLRSLMAVPFLVSAGLAVGMAVVRAPAVMAQESQGEAGTLSAEEAIENAKDAYYVREEGTVRVCPQGTAGESVEGEEGNVIVVCRELGPANPFQTREGPRPGMDRTADGVVRAPDVTTIPPCNEDGGPLAVCMKGVGWAPPPVLMVDVTKFPEPLSDKDAAKVFRAPDEAVASAEEPSPPD